MKYTTPTILTQHNALTAILGVKGIQQADDASNPMLQRTTAAGYESDE